MDDFTPYGCDFLEALSNLGKELNKCIEMNLSHSLEKCKFLTNVGTILGHSISREGIQVDPNKIAIMKRIPTHQNQRDVRSLLGLVGYYRRSIKELIKLCSPLFGLLEKGLKIMLDK